MKKNSFFLLSLALIVFVYFIFNFEFRTPILMGFILSALTYPVYQFQNKFLSRIKLSFIPKSVTALSTVIFSAVILYISSSYIIFQLIKEMNVYAPDAFNWIADLFESERFIGVAKSVGLSSSETSNLSSDLVKSVEPYLTDIISLDNVNRVVSFSTQFFRIVFNQFIYIIISIIAWYNGLVYGKKWIDQLISFLPIDDDNKKLIKKDLKAGVNNVIYANLLSGLLNGFVVLVIMSIFNVPGAFLGAIFAFLIGFLPLTPSELSFLPAIVFLLFTNPFSALIVGILGELFVLFLNYVFLPKITLAGTEGNPLFIITSVLSGIAIFGIMGFIIGPTIMIFINTLSYITSLSMKEAQASNQ